MNFKIPKQPTNRVPIGVSTTSIEKKDEGVIHETKRFHPTTLRKGEGFSGFSFGLTIPGPSKSYMTARIDAYVSFPHEATPAAASATLKECATLVGDMIAEEAEEVNKFFETYGRKE